MNSTTRAYVIAAMVSGKRHYIAYPFPDVGTEGLKQYGMREAFDIDSDLQKAVVFGSERATVIVEALRKYKPVSYAWAAIPFARFDDDGNETNII